MSGTIPTRIDRELFEAAKSIGEVVHRSAAQQLAHWARIGRELESSPGISPGDVQRVLSGENGFGYDRLTEPDQALVRSEWDERISARLATLNLAERFTQEGRSWTEADGLGNAVERGSNEI